MYPVQIKINRAILLNLDDDDAGDFHTKNTHTHDSDESKFHQYPSLYINKHQTKTLKTVDDRTPMIYMLFKLSNGAIALWYRC